MKRRGPWLARRGREAEMEHERNRRLRGERERRLRRESRSPRRGADEDEAGHFRIRI